jgi:hypothetical protein
MNEKYAQSTYQGSIANRNLSRLAFSVLETSIIRGTEIRQRRLGFSPVLGPTTTLALTFPDRGYDPVDNFDHLNHDFLTLV